VPNERVLLIRKKRGGGRLRPATTAAGPALVCIRSRPHSIKSATSSMRIPAKRTGANCTPPVKEFQADPPPKFEYADVDASIHAADKCLLKKGREPRSCGCDVLHVLQLLPGKSDIARHTCDRSRLERSRLGCGRTVQANGAHPERQLRPR
jgi:hypothetical protein